MNKKAQLQIQETILVIFIFIVILGMGLILFNKFNQQSIKEIGDNDKLTYFYSMVGNFPNLPEIKCSYLGSEKECIDVSKLISFKNNDISELINFKNKENSGLNITIYTIYPNKSNKECTLSVLNQKQDCGTFLVYNNIPAKCRTEFCEKKVISTPVSLYYPDKDVYEFGKLIIEVYL